MLSLKRVAYDEGTMYLPLSSDALESLTLLVKMVDCLKTAGTMVHGNYVIREGMTDDEDSDDLQRKRVFDKLRELGFEIVSRGYVFEPTDETLGNSLYSIVESVSKDSNIAINLRVAFNFYNSLIYDGALQFPSRFDSNKSHSRSAVENAIAAAIVDAHGKKNLTVDGKIRAMECVRKNLFY